LAGQPVVPIDVDAARIARINAEGLRLETEAGTFEVPNTLSCRDLPAPAEAGVPGIQPTAGAGASGWMDSRRQAPE
jgi:hypothetical protein